ncbi:DUF5776 domain-containing protein [Enterococcus mediterraneensis]|uniref:DUF5776 domain-containing protein n=1 Tax=Enterococcus mediterraneensis TaxID=2364791 RepID=UPI000F06D53F|nr:DUF5776 domain-containing protein [Enterococcus mediterraneensis]
MKKKCFGFILVAMFLCSPKAFAEGIGDSGSDESTYPASEKISQATVSNSTAIESSTSANESSTLNDESSSTESSVETKESVESSTQSTEKQNETSSSQKSYELSLNAFPSDEGRSDLYEVVKPPVQRTARTAVLSIPDIPHDSTNTPTKDFIDISSHNGIISVANFRMMKNFGVKAVVVKLTEYTTYRNEYAKVQIANAQAAGLLVHAYHYSWFTSTAEAIKEADYFAKFAAELKLPKSTVMVNDIEEPKIKDNKNHTQNSQAFANRLNQLGYSNVQHYIGLNWINEGRINAKTLGEKNVWIAAYPYNPTKTQLYTAYGAWQWTSRVFYPGIASTFDMSSDYAKKFTTQPQTATYYQTNPGYVTMKKDDYIYLSTDFSTKNRGRKISKTDVFKVEGIERTSGGTPRLKISEGYLTANTAYVNKITSKYQNYLYKGTSTGYIYLKKADYSYTSTDFKTTKTRYAGGTPLKITGLAYSADGYPRFKLSDGSYISTNKNIVGVLTANYNTYYLTNPSFVCLKKDDYYYKDLSFKERGTAVKKGTVVKVTGIEYTASSGVPRLVTSKGYLTANKNYVAKITSKYANYYTNVKKVKFLKDDYYYTSTNFVSQNRSTKIKKGQVVTVTGTDFDANGYPRLKTANGYITANKAYVREQ